MYRFNTVQNLSVTQDYLSAPFGVRLKTHPEVRQIMLNRVSTYAADIRNKEAHPPRTMVSVATRAFVYTNRQHDGAHALLWATCDDRRADDRLAAVPSLPNDMGY